MKNIKAVITMVGLLSIGIFPAQIAMQKAQADGDGLLDFATNTTNGILLPIVETLPTDAKEGTILMDKNDKIIKMYTGLIWVPLSDAGSITGITFNASAEIAGTNRVIMGASTSNAPGVLVLESANKALILPKVATPHTNVKSPYPGMICYDTTSKSLAVFDGLKWSYWK